MAIALKHAFVSAIADNAAAVTAGEVVPSNWNADHVLTQATARMLGRVTAGTGATEELTPAQVASFLSTATALTIAGAITATTATGRVSLGVDAGGSISLGRIDGVASTPYFDFNSGATLVDYDARIMASGGTGVAGNGMLTHTAATHSFVGNMGVGTSTPESWYSLSARLAVVQNQNAETIFGLSNSTSGAAAAVSIRKVGGTANSFAIDRLNDATGAPYQSYEFGSGVGSLRWLFNGSEKVRMDSSGRVGIGSATPAWDSTYKTISLGTTAAFNGNDAGLSFANNAYYDGANWKYITTEAATQHYQYQSRHVWSSAASGTAGNNVTFVPVLQVDKAKSLALEGATSQTGTGITFPATQSASANANTLDDYEEGTWTPSLTFGGAAVGMTYSVQSGTYTKIGRLVYVQFRILLTAKGSSTGSCLIEGLPFSVATASGVNGVMDPAAGMTGLTETTMGLCNGSVIYLMKSIARTQLQDTNFSNTSDIRFGGVYEV